MKLKIIRIENNVSTCELDDDQLLDIAIKWLPKNTQVGDILEVDLSEKQKNGYHTKM